MRILKWLNGEGWGALQTVYQSQELSSDQPDGATDANGVSHWVWTEQDADNVNIIGIAAKTTAGSALQWVAREVGFATSPSMVFPPDNLAMVAWSSPEDTIDIAQEPYGVTVHMGGSGAYGPRMAVDSEGFTHVVFYAQHESGVQQIFHTSNRP
jgi:hypothetical protein